MAEISKKDIPVITPLQQAERTARIWAGVYGFQFLGMNGTTLSVKPVRTDYDKSAFLKKVNSYTRMAEITLFITT